MDYPFTQKLHQLIIKAQKEEHLQQITSLLGNGASFKGTLWVGGDLEVNPKWDLIYWLKRCGAGKYCAFEYDVDKDVKEEVSLHFSLYDEEEQISNDFQSLPLTLKGSKSAFFLDRDGIINCDQAYVHKVVDVEFVAGIVDFIQFLQNCYDYVIVLTNQSGVGRGYYQEEDVVVVHKWMQEDLEKSGARITGWYYCPFHPNGEVEQYHHDSYLRKPHAGMALKAAVDYDLDLSRCAMVGDKDSDYLRDLQLETYLIQGNYSLTLELPKFSSLDELRDFLAKKKRPL